MKGQDLLVPLGPALLLASCVSVPPTTVRETVGPEPAALHVPAGLLKVYSATEEYDEGDVYRYPHTGYSVYTRDGRLIKGVNNALSIRDEEPENVLLPSGAYTVLADSETAGRVSVPVVIRNHQVTVLHLQRKTTWTPPAFARASDFVRLPHGQAIGFRATVR